MRRGSKGCRYLKQRDGQPHGWTLLVICNGNLSQEMRGLVVLQAHRNQRVDSKVVEDVDVSAKGAGSLCHASDDAIKAISQAVETPEERRPEVCVHHQRGATSEPHHEADEGQHVGVQKGHGASKGPKGALLKVTEEEVKHLVWQRSSDQRIGLMSCEEGLRAMRGDVRVSAEVQLVGHVQEEDHKRAPFSCVPHG